MSRKKKFKDKMKMLHVIMMGYDAIFRLETTDTRYLNISSVLQVKHFLADSAKFLRRHFKSNWVATSCSKYFDRKAEEAEELIEGLLS